MVGFVFLSFVRCLLVLSEVLSLSWVSEHLGIWVSGI